MNYDFPSASRPGYSDTNPAAPPKADDEAGSPKFLQRAAGKLSPEAKTMSECVIASGVAVALGLVAAYNAMTGDTPALTVGVPTLCMMGAFIAGSYIRSCLRWVDHHVREREYLADITIFDLQEQVDEAWRRMEWWRNQAGDLAIDLDVAAGSTARSAECTVLEFRGRE